MIKSYQEGVGAEVEAEEIDSINFLLPLLKEEIETAVTNMKMKNLAEVMITLLVQLIKESAQDTRHILNMIKANDIMKD
jgi:hypothetical protein